MSQSRYLTKTVKSSDLVKVMEADKDKLDPRLVKLTDAVKKEIEKNHWKVPENEKEICNKIAELMHSKDFYGPYSKNFEAGIKRLGEINSRIFDLENNLDFIKPKLTEQEAKKEIGKLEKEKTQINEKLQANNNTSLKETKYGETVCLQQAAIMSYVMDKVGLPNDFCSGVNSSESVEIQHAFVQSRTGEYNVIDSTIPEKHGTYYLENQSGTRIANGDAVVVGVPNSPKEGVTYGGGKTGFFQQVFNDLNDEKLSHIAAENRGKIEHKWIDEHKGGLIVRLDAYKSEERLVVNKNSVNDNIIEKEVLRPQFDTISKDVIRQVQNELSKHSDLVYTNEQEKPHSQDKLDDVVLKLQQSVAVNRDSSINLEGTLKPSDIAMKNGGNAERTV